MVDSDFTVGFKQGQSHGKEIVLEQVADARREMEKCIAVFENSDNENGKFVQKGIEIGLSILNKFVRDE